MAFKTSSKQKTSTSSAVSSSSSGGVAISQVYITDASYVNSDDTAIGTSGGYLKLVGSGFVTGCVVYVNNAAVTTTFVSAGEVRAVVPSASAGTYSLTVFNTNSGGSIWASGLAFSGFPTVTTSSYTSTQGAVVNTQIAATGDGTLSYALQGGSTLPTGVTLSSTGLVSGTATELTANTVVSFTVLVNDSQNQTIQQAITISLIFGDLYFKNVTALLSGDTFVNTTDSSLNKFAITEIAAPIASNLTPFQDSYSASFNGTTQYLTVPDNVAITVGSSDFTLECWIYPTSFVANQYMWFHRNNTLQAIGIGFGIEVTTGNIRLLAGDSSSTDWEISHLTTSGVILNTWSHVALTRSSSTWKIYINGSLISTITSSITVFDTGVAYIGGASATTGPFSGYISNLRLVKGTAVYTGAFTPPTSPLTAIAGTSLLTCQSNYFKDTSTNDFIITNGGSTPISQRTPFETTPSATLGSTSFNGSSQYLTVPTSTTFNFGTGDFTVEAWVNFSSVAASGYIIDFRLDSAAGSNQAPSLAYQSSSGKIIYISGTTVNITGTTTITSGIWYHVALTRNSGTTKLYVNGTLNGSFVDSGSYTNYTNRPIIGAFASGANTFMSGRISNLRVVKGTAVYTANFTPSTTPLTAISGTSLLTLQSPVPNHNNTFVDSGPNNLAITNTGTPTQGSFSPFGSNWSNYFDGTGDYLSIPTNAAFEFGSGDFTTECWIYPIAFNAIDGGFMTVGAQDGGASWVLRGAANESLSFTTWSSGGTVGISFSSAAGSLKFNNWSHIAVTRSGNTWGIWVNGTSVATTTGSSAIGNTGRPAYIAYGYSSTAGRQQNCYISNVRWVKGTAVYTGAFTPSTTPLTAIAGTSLLTCQSNRIKDSSTNNFAITKVGDTTVSSYSPFSTTTGYVPSIYSGSMYFNGTTDYIALPNSSSEINLSSGDFTVECWFNTTNAVTAQTLVWLGGNTSAYSAIRFGIDTNGLIFYGSNDGASWVINTGALGSGIVSNTWNHAAVARFGNVIKVFLNGNQVGTDIAKSGSFWTSGTLNYIGSLNYTAVGGTPFRQMNGYISNVRIVKGTALYTANFTPSTTPLTAVTNTGLLLSGTNAGIIDSSMQSNYTTVGDSKVSSGAVKYGTGAMYFDGTGDYLNGPFSPLYAIESCDFTVEAWVYRNAIGAEHNIAITRDVAGGDGWNLRINATNTLQFYYNAGTSISSTGTIPLNTWTHIAATRNGTAGKLFINGVIDGTATFVNGTTTTQRLRIGVSATNAAGYFNGYIDDLRITKGFARYTANFTPSAVAFLKN